LNVIFRKGKKTDNMRFSSEWRATIITEALRLIQKAGNETVNPKVKQKQNKNYKKILNILFLY
jgi:hypothetical protein